MATVLDSIQPVIQRSRFVRMNEKMLESFCATIQTQDVRPSTFAQTSLLRKGTEEEQIAFSVICNTLLFSFWGDPKWTITLDGKSYDGSEALVFAFRHAVEQNIPLLDPGYLANITEEKIATILRGNVEIPLLKERAAMLQVLGRTIQEKYKGSYTEILLASGGSADTIVELLVRDLPSVFDDVAYYHGFKVQFYKRAQLIAAHFFDLRRLGILSHPLTHEEALTAFADYKIPQLLRYFGILEYSDDLQERIDHRVEIPSGSDEEIEIRALTIWAVEKATCLLRSSIKDITATKVDMLFWQKGQEKNSGVPPYHRTRTIWY